MKTKIIAYHITMKILKIRSFFLWEKIIAVIMILSLIYVHNTTAMSGNFLATPSSSGILDITVSEKPHKQEGTRASEPLVMSVMLSLGHLIGTEPMVLYELVMLARDPNYQLHGFAAKVLKNLGLVSSDGSIVHDVRKIILSAVIESEFEISLINPLANMQSESHEVDTSS